MKNAILYNKKLQPNAKALRISMTKAEACIWKYLLKSRQMEGLQFRRQRPIGNYIVDFCCLELNLIIEIDGITHDFEEQFIKDKIREENLINLGFKIVRFSDNDVLKNIEGVRFIISQKINKMVKLRLVEKPPPSVID